MIYLLWEIAQNTIVELFKSGISLSYLSSKYGITKSKMNL